MDACFADIIVEFLCVAFHNILYHSGIYPETIYEPRRQYNVVVYRSIHPEINSYIDMCMKSITECLKNNQLSCVNFIITSDSYEPLVKFVFDINKCDNDITNDAYLIQAEQNLRAFCLKLPTVSKQFQCKPGDNRSFKIELHTTEAVAVAIASNPDLHEFPLIEITGKLEENSKIIPLRRFPIRQHFIDSYIEIN